MSPLDWFVFLGYIAIVALLGIAFSRNKTLNSFFFAGGSLPWVAVGISLIATSISAATFLGNPADAYQNNLSLFMLNFGSLLSILFVNRFFIPKFREKPWNSAYELLEDRFSQPIRKIVAVLYCLHLLLRTGVLMFGPSLVLSALMGWHPVFSILVTAIVATVYTYFGGLKAVVWTDVLQFVVFMVGGIFVVWFASNSMDGLPDVLARASELGKTKVFNWEYNPASARNVISAVLVYSVFEVAIRSCDQQFIQRYISCKNVKDAQKSSLLSAIAGAVAGSLFYIVGVVLFMYYGEFHQELTQTLTANEVFPHFIAHYVPTGIKGMLAAALFAAAMSSLDSALTALSNTAMVDLLPKRNRSLSDSAKVRTARRWTLLWGLLGSFAALICLIGDESLLEKALFYTSLFIGPIFSVFFAAFYLPSVQSKAAAAGALSGALAILLYSRFVPMIMEFYPSLSIYSVLFQFHPLWNPLNSFMVAVLVMLCLSRRNTKNGS
jgi:solute:Na+ symporter, SSS family